MNWERKALEDIIWLLAEEEGKFNELYNKLDDLNIQLDMNGASYNIISKLADGMAFLAENFDVLVEETNESDKRQLVEIFIDQIQKNYIKD